MKMAEFMTSDSPYLCKEMLWDTPVVVTIDHVEGNHDVPIPDSSRTQKKKVMFFEGKRLGLVINAGHRKFLKRVFGGNDTREWKGRQVLLYVEPAATYQGQRVGGIRMAVKTGRGVVFSGTDKGAQGPPRGAPVPIVTTSAPVPREDGGPPHPSEEPGGPPDEGPDYDRQPGEDDE